jgi:glycosyltransferase involved in cell wall biosynthesis
VPLEGEQDVDDGPVIGLVAPLPPQVGGVAGVAEWLLTHEKAIGCHYSTFDLWRPASGESGGRLRAGSILQQLRLLGRFLRWVPRAPQLIHYHASATPTGLTRDLVYLLVLQGAGHRTIAHVHVVHPASRFWRRAIRLLGRLTVERVAVSDWSARVLAASGVPARAILNPIRIKPATVQKREKRPVTKILFVGSYGRGKGTPQLLQALASVRESGVEMDLRIVGKEMHRGEEKYLRELVEDLALGDVVEFAGVLSAVELPDVYLAADLFCLPSLDEGLPLAILEAMAFGLPVVSTRVAAIPEVVKDEETGLIVEPGDVQGLAAALTRLAGDGEGSRRMGRLGSEWILERAGAASITAAWRQTYSEFAPGGSMLTRRGVPGDQLEGR